MMLESGLETLQSNPEFRGPFEPHVDHPHANDHFALVYESQAEQFAAAIPFIRQGLERDERCLYITYENSREEVEAAMRDYGIDVDAALGSGQLSIHDEQEAYLRNETFDADETVEFIDAAIEEVTEEYEALRMTGEMSSVLQADPECEELVKCEAKANYLFDEVDGIALCQYNRNRFPAEVIRDVISTHPLLIHDGRVSYNVYYTPPQEFFGPDKIEREVDRLLGSLREQTDAKAELHRRERFLREGYQITADPDLEFEEKLHRLLDLARERTGLDAAGLTHLPEWDGKFRTEYALGYGDGDGVVTAADELWTDPDNGCYCRQTIVEDEPVGMADVRGTDWESDEIYRENGLTSYLGTRVTIGPRPYGTLWVGGTEPRDRAFTETEKTFLELIGQWVSNELERREHTDAQQALYEVAADPDREFDEKLDALFDLGRNRFGLDIGGMVKVDPDEDRLEVESVSETYGEFEPGLEPPLSGTYCGAAYGADSPTTITDPVAEGYDDGFAYQELGFRAYLGTHIEVDGGRDRLFFFTTMEPRDRGFSETECTFLELIGQWVKHELERQQRERELERTLDLLEKAERIADVGGWEIDVETRDVFWTDHIFELLEVSADDEPPLEEALDMYHEEDQPIVENAVENAFDSGEPFDAEVRVRTASDEVRWLRLQGVPETVGDEVVSLRGTAQDITERKAREEQLEATVGQLEDKNARLDNFASMLAHELRNPVAIGQIYSKQLANGPNPDALAYVREAFDRIEDMVDVMLVLTRGQEAVDERSPIDLGGVARDAWGDVDAPDADLVTTVDDVIEADETYVQHLFRNLFENAVKHGGRDVTVTVGDLADGDGFYVADDGTGIPPEVRDAVFDEGYTTAADNGGTGLGLAFVQKLAEVYDWDCCVTESEAGGARFEFRSIT